MSNRTKGLLAAAGLLAVGVAAVAIPPAWRAASVAWELRTARAALDRHDPDAATSAALRAQALRPDDPQITRLLAAIGDQLGPYSALPAGLRVLRLPGATAEDKRRVADAAQAMEMPALAAAPGQPLQAESNPIPPVANAKEADALLRQRRDAPNTFTAAALELIRTGQARAVWQWLGALPAADQNRLDVRVLQALASAAMTDWDGVNEATGSPALVLRAPGDERPWGFFEPMRRALRLRAVRAMGGTPPEGTWAEIVASAREPAERVPLVWLAETWGWTAEADTARHEL